MGFCFLAAPNLMRKSLDYDDTNEPYIFIASGTGTWPDYKRQS